jgi:hypothetical protein
MLEFLNQHKFTISIVIVILVIIILSIIFFTENQISIGSKLMIGIFLVFPLGIQMYLTTKQPIKSGPVEEKMEQPVEEPNLENLIQKDDEYEQLQKQKNVYENEVSELNRVISNEVERKKNCIQTPDCIIYSHILKNIIKLRQETIQLFNDIILNNNKLISWYDQYIKNDIKNDISDNVRKYILSLKNTLLEKNSEKEYTQDHSEKIIEQYNREIIQLESENPIVNQ